MWLQHGEKAGRAAHDKDGEAGMSLVHTAYFLVTGGKSVDFILSAWEAFGQILCPQCQDLLISLNSSSLLLLYGKSIHLYIQQQFPSFLIDSIGLLELM